MLHFPLTARRTCGYQPRFSKIFATTTVFIAVPKTYVTIFHNEQDASVKYEDKKVYVDGRRVQIHFYGREVEAADIFKYLGIT